MENCKNRLNRKKGMGLVLLTIFVVGISIIGIVSAHHYTPGDAGQTKINIYDNTHNGWNVLTNDPDTGTPDPVIGFVNFRPTVPLDPSNIIVTVALKDGAPSCTYNIELVTSGSDNRAGLQPDGTHFGYINIIGTLTTNQNGIGNSGDIVVDVTGLSNIAVSGGITYAHVDLEAQCTCIEADGTTVEDNEYGASGEKPDQGLGLPVNMHWLQP